MATAAFHDIRRAFPSSHVTLLLKPGRQRVVAGSEDFDDIITDRSSGAPRQFVRTVLELRRRRFDLAVLFADSLRSRLIARLAGIPRRVGYVRNLGGFLLTDRVRYPGPGGAKIPEPMPLRFGRLVTALGTELGDLRPRLAVPAECEVALRGRLDRLGIAGGAPLIGLSPGASFGASKIWPPEHFAALGDHLVARYGAQVVILVGPGEEPIAREIEARMREPAVSTADDLVPLDELKALVRELRLLVTTDTGPRHYAVAFGVPTVVLMGPTDPRHTDIHLERTVVMRLELPCSPCHLKVCPIDHRCMRDLGPESVLESIEELDRRVGVFGRSGKRVARGDL